MQILWGKALWMLVQLTCYVGWMIQVIRSSWPIVTKIAVPI